MRSRSIIALATLAALALTLAGSGTARADVIDKAIARYGRISRGDLATVLWARKPSSDKARPETCAGARDDADRRVCRLLAQRARETAAKKTLTTLRLAPAPITAGEYNPRSKSMPVVVEGCLFCKGFSAGGRELAVVGRMGSQTTAEPLRNTALVFEDAEVAKKWADESLPRMVADVIVEIPAELDLVPVSGQEGVFLSVKAYRIFDPCTGAVAVSKPALERVAVDDQACAAARKRAGQLEGSEARAGSDAPGDDDPAADAATRGE